MTVQNLIFSKSKSARAKKAGAGKTSPATVETYPKKGRARISLASGNRAKLGESAGNPNEIPADFHGLFG